MPKTPVCNSAGRIILWATESEVERMVQDGQAERKRKCVTLLSVISSDCHYKPTRISNGRHPGAAMGLSQVYTAGRHADTPHKWIAPQDKHFFDCSNLPQATRAEHTLFCSHHHAALEPS